MVGVSYMRCFMTYGPETLRQQDIVYPEQRPQTGESRTESMSCFAERILSAAHHPEIGIGHRIVIEISADECLYRTVLDVGKDLVDLLRSSFYGAFHLGAGLGKDRLVRTEYPFEDTGEGYVVAFEVTVVYPEPAVVHFIVSVYGQVGAFIKFDLALVLDRDTTQGDIAESGAVGHREHIEFCPVAFHLPPQIRPYLFNVGYAELLQAHNVGILTSDKGKYGVGALCPAAYIPIIKGKAADIVGNYLDRRVLGLRHVFGRQLHISSYEEKRRQKSQKRYYKGTGQAFERP